MLLEPIPKQYNSIVTESEIGKNQGIKKSDQGNSGNMIGSQWNLGKIREKYFYGSNLFSQETKTWIPFGLIFLILENLILKI